MRTGFHGGWIEADGKLVGISLGADFCAEHEWGIGEIKRLLGMDGQKAELSREKVVYTKPPGLPRRMITRHGSVRLYEHNGAAALLCDDDWWMKRFDESIAKEGIAKAFKDRLPRDLPRTELGTAWSGGDFGIYGTEENAERLRDLYQAFQADNIAVWIGGVKIFENGGLIVCIADRIPAENVKMLHDADTEAERLEKASDATGILKRLNSAGKGFFACSPRWRANRTDQPSTYDVIYWLNPAEQDKNNFGWFTVEELDQWIGGTGPVPMKTVKA